MYQETADTRELVGFLRDDMDGEFLAGQVGAGKFEGFRGVVFLDVVDRRADGGQCPERLVGIVRILGPGRVVVGGHTFYLEIYLEILSVVTAV